MEQDKTWTQNKELHEKAYSGYWMYRTVINIHLNNGTTVMLSVHEHHVRRVQTILSLALLAMYLYVCVVFFFCEAR